MLHGKKGFERIVWAFKNVLNRSVTWLFHDFDPKSGCKCMVKCMVVVKKEDADKGPGKMTNQ